MELISIITPAYNAEKYISETIDSVLKQTYVNWELIIIDDCSTDSTSEIVQNYQKKDDRIKYYRLANNSGAAATPRNKGIEISRGEYIAFLDSDDLWLAEKLEKQIESLKLTNTDLIYTYTAYLLPNKDKMFYKTRNVNSLLSLIVLNPIALSSVIVRKTKNINFDIDPKITGAQDLFLWINLYKKGYKFSLLPETLTIYRYLPNSMLHKHPLKSLFEGYWTIIKFAKKNDYNKLTIVFLIISQTIIRVGNVLLGIIKRKIISIFKHL